MSTHPLQTLGRTGLAVLVLSLVVVAPATAFAPVFDGEVPAHVAGLHHALGQRIATIEALPEPTKPQLKEAKLLGKARDQLEQYLGDDDKKDLKRLTAATASIDKSKTADESVLAWRTQVRDRLDQVGQTLRQAALGSVGLLQNEKVGEKVTKTVAKADALRETGLQTWETKPGKGASILAKAVNKYRAGLSKGFKKQVKEALKVPNDVQPTAFTVLTQEPQIYHPIRVLVETEVAQPTPELSLALRAFLADDIDGADPDAPVEDVTLGVLTLKDVPAGTRQDELEFRIPVVRNENVVKKEGPPDFGRNVSVSGDTVAATVNDNQVFVFDRDAGGPGAWGQVATLAIPNAPVEPFNMLDVAVHGDTIAVGDVSNDDLGAGVGAAHVFERGAGGPGAWGHVATLYPGDLPGGDMLFGSDLALDGDTLVVSAIEVGSHTGAVYVFRRDAGGPGAWGQVAAPQSPSPAAFGNFGVHVALDGDRLVVGEDGVDDQTGKVHVYERDAGGAEQWGHVATITNPGGGSFDHFGFWLDVDADTIAVGVPDADHSGLTDVGLVHVFERNGGGVWQLAATLDAGASVATTIFFGGWLALEDDVLVTGGWGGPGTDGGSVFARTEDEKGDSTWSWIMKLEDETGELIAGDDAIALTAAMDGDTVVVGNYAGAMHIFTGMERVAPGDYYIAVQADPHDRLIELLAPDSEDNNLLVDDDRTSFSGDQINAPNVILEAIELSPHKMFVDTDGTNAVPMSLNARVSMTGKHDGPLTGVVLRGFATMLVDVGGNPQPVTQTMRFLPEGSPDPNAFVEELPLPPLVVHDPLDLHVDIQLVLPPETPLLDEGNYVGDYTVFVDVDGQYEPEGDDDQLSIDDFPYNVIEIEDCSFTQTFTTSLGNPNVRGTVDMAAHLDIVGDTSEAAGFGLFVGSEAEAGLVASVQGIGRVDFFGVSADLIDAAAVIERDPIQDYGFLAADLVFQEPLSGKAFTLYAFGPYDSIDLQQDGLQLPDGVSECDGGFCYEKTFDVDKSFEKEAVFLVAGIPVTVTGTVEGAIGIDITAEAHDELSLEVEPFLETSASARAEVGVCEFEFDDPTGLTDFLGFSFEGGGCVGAEGQITLIEDRFRAKVGVGMSVVEGIDGLGNEATSIDTAMCFNVRNDLDMLHGKLFAFAVWTTPKWCSGFLGIPYPCGTQAHKEDEDIVSWHGFSFDHVLIDATEPLCCVPVVGLPICPAEGTSICSLDD